MADTNINTTFRAGLSRTIVTPPQGTYLIGYAGRSSGCQSVHDDLTATALALDDGAKQLIIVALDMLALNEHTVARVRAGIAEQWQIPGEQVMICCSHTHSGPLAYADEKSEGENRRFISGLVGKLVAVVGEALVELVPATATWGQGEAHIAVNRRQLWPDGTVIIGINPDGPVGRSLNVLQVCHRDSSQALVTLVNLACHATVLGPRINAVSAEWPGVLRREVEAATSAPCMFIQGAAGDLNPNHKWGDDDVKAMEQLGHQVAEQVLHTIPDLEPFIATPLLTRSEAAWLPIVPQTGPDGKQLITYREALAPWEARLGQRDGQWNAIMEIQAFRLGDCALVAHAAETFNEIGVAIKNSSPALITLFAGYSNGCIGYLPTAAAHALGGYEIELAPYVYDMPGLLDPGCEELVTKQSLQMLQALWN